MTPEPRLLRGTTAIAAHGGITNRLAQHLINQRQIPVWMDKGTPMATAGALDEWSLLKRTGKF